MGHLPRAGAEKKPLSLMPRRPTCFRVAQLGQTLTRLSVTPRQLPHTNGRSGKASVPAYQHAPQQKPRRPAPPR